MIEHYHSFLYKLSIIQNLISARSALLGELFESIAAAARKIPLIETPSELNKKKFNYRLLPKKSSKRDAEKRDLSKAIHSFGYHMSRLGQYAQLAEILIPGACMAGSALRAGGES